MDVISYYLSRHRVVVVMLMIVIDNLNLKVKRSFKAVLPRRRNLVQLLSNLYLVS